MNAIIAVALLAVCASAQVFDQTTDLNRILLKNKYTDLTTSDLLRTNGLFDKTTLFNTKLTTPWVMPRTFDNKVDTTIYTLDELVRIPLFNKFLTLPLFRQHLTSPLFQYYLTTPLFQQYWTIPEFQTFFTNPYLFNKYVYPVVFNTHSTTSVFDKMNTMDTTMYPVDTLINKVNTMNTMYPVDTLETLLNKNTKTNMMMNNMYPTMINRNQVPYTMTMEKLFKNLINKPTMEVITDVKVMDNNKVNTLTYKIVDGKIIPVVADRKIVLDDILRRPIDRTMVDILIRKPTMINELLGDKIMPIEKMNMINENMNIKDIILKKLLLNKIMYGDKKIDEIFPEYTTTEMKNIPIFEKINKINKINRLENIMGENKMMNTMIPTTMNIDEMIRTPVTSDLFLRKYNKDLLTNIPMTKEMKDFTIETPMTMTDKIMNIMPEFKNTMDLEKPIKTVIV